MSRLVSLLADCYSLKKIRRLYIADCIGYHKINGQTFWMTISISLILCLFEKIQNKDLGELNLYFLWAYIPQETLRNCARDLNCSQRSDEHHGFQIRDIGWWLVLSTSSTPLCLNITMVYHFGIGTDAGAMPSDTVAYLYCPLVEISLTSSETRWLYRVCGLTA